MPSIFFFSKNLFVFERKFFLFSFIANLFVYLRRFFSFYFLRFKMHGVGYRVKHLTSNLIRFFFATTNFYYFIAPSSVFVRGRRRRLLLVSNNKELLVFIFLSFFSLKKIIPYKLRGFFFPKQIVLMKPGKRRF